MLTPVMTVACADHIQSDLNTDKYLLSLSLSPLSLGQTLHLFTIPQDVTL